MVLLVRDERRVWSKVMLGGAWFNQCFSDVDSCDVNFIVNTAVNAVSQHLNIRCQPTTVKPHILKVFMLRYVRNNRRSTSAHSLAVSHSTHVMECEIERCIV